MPVHAICQCNNPGCRLRYPAGMHEAASCRCPRCGTPVEIIHHLNERCETRSEVAAAPSTPGLAVLLDNVRSIFNVGSIFRSADGAGFATLYLCGVTPTPEHPKLAKTALGAEHYVHWTSHPNAVLLAQELRAAGHGLWALEETDSAESLYDAPAPPHPTVLVVGSEVTGVDPDLLSLCEKTLAIPMSGSKRSLNVATAFGVAALILARKMQAAQRPAAQPAAPADRSWP